MSENTISLWYAFAFMCCCYGSLARNIEENQANANLKNELQSLRGELVSLQSQVSCQQKTISSLEKKTENVLQLEQAIQKHNLTIQQQTLKIQNLKHIVTSNPSQQYQQTEFGCFSELISLWCVEGGVINVTEAYYGMYSETCDSGECCMPDQVDDCRVSVLDVRPSDWVSLKVTCDNRTSCTFEYLGAAIDDCEENYLADYMQIDYNCESETADSYDPVGFTVYKEYDQFCDDHLEFTGVITNIGNAFDTTNSSFTCPYTGVYMFSVAVKIRLSDGYLTIRRNSENIAQIWADGDDVNNLSTPTGVVVIECEADQVVWIECGYSAYYQGSSDRESLFAGYMLYTYE